jgi:hypothetical protein
VENLYEINVSREVGAAATESEMAPEVNGSQCAYLSWSQPTEVKRAMDTG